MKRRLANIQIGNIRTNNVKNYGVRLKLQEPPNSDLDQQIDWNNVSW